MFSDDTIAEEESNGHSLYGASKWHRLLVCAGSLAAELGKPDTARFEAAEGTVAHEIASRWLQHGVEAVRPVFPIGSVVKMKLNTGDYDIPVSETMYFQIGRYVDWVYENPGTLLVEQRVDFSRLTPIPKQGGTMDAAVLAPGHLVVTDLKYGTGVQIFAEENPQVIAYALGIIFEWQLFYSFDRVTIRVCQPRLDHFDVWETTVAELLEWAEWAKARLALTYKPDAKRTPSEKACQFCKARPTCPVAMNIVDRLADATFDDMSFDGTEATSAIARIESPNYKFLTPSVAELTTAQLGRMLEFRKVAEHAFDAAYDELVLRCVTGNEPLPANWMLANGKAQRSVRDKEMVLSVLSKLEISVLDAYEVEFRSPAQLEALLIEHHISKRRATELLKPAIYSRDGKPTLALRTKGKKDAVDLADLTFDDETASENL